MRLGLMVGYSGARLQLPLETIKEAERLGFDSVWVAEAYGSDAVTTASWILANTSTIKVGTAIMQLGARTPACTAMTAMSLDHLSGGRFILGLGPSGPQVVEGWHGVPYGKPITRLKEYVEIVRKILAREAPLAHQGEHYQIPYRGLDGTGLGKPLKSILHGDPGLKIYTAGITPNGVRAAAEIADGFFPVWMEPERFDLFAEPLAQGFAAAGKARGLAEFDVAPFVRVVLGDDLDACRRPIKEHLALYIGGMGARSRNFYNDYTRRLGYAEAAARIQDLYLAGRKEEAIAAVPDALVDACSLVGPRGRIHEGLARWKAAAARGEVGTLVVAGGASVEALRLLAAELL
ncbi:MAG: LLM class F420-dependent oxidoreductase [Gammaproteobacteria bacterium]|nr:LLM class F420-dependent oxidoreductase [Gammaproteobacteria bacterium]